MRLSKLTLSGFKSFADTTEFTFDQPITGIVGPNGCGKSNVVDAVKWVLGERSSKSLRGTEMLDVIFAGSAVRKPLGMASVKLSFENPIIDDTAQPAPAAAAGAEPAAPRAARRGHRRRRKRVGGAHPASRSRAAACPSTPTWSRSNAPLPRRHQPVPDQRPQGSPARHP